ncbi:arginase family protein [Bacillus stratosphericus]|uniref:arginase family protein n=1 Tax=Bacillus stratosphericus TaxID=293386 RepID=UPI001CFB1677|nr:arginase family protein [Bacillus stratosphericus]
MANKYEIVQKDNEYLFLRDRKSNSYYKVEHEYEDILPSVSKLEHKPFFNYILPDNKPDTVIFGIPFNKGSRFPNSTVNQFPNILRQTSHKLQHHNQYPEPIPLKLFHLDSGKEVECGKLMDLGDVSEINRYSVHESIQEIVSFCMDNSYPFVSIGGDHSYTFDVVSSLKDVNKPLVIWVLDAHNDLYGSPDKLDHGNVFSYIAELSFVEAIVQIGSRGFRTFEQIVSHPKVIQISRDSFNMKTFEQLIKRFKGLAHYLSIDLDCLDPYYFPFVDFGVPGGFSKSEIFAIIQTIFGNGFIIGADIVEGNAEGNVVKGNYDIPLELLILLLSHLKIQKEGSNEVGYKRKSVKP